MEIQQSLCKMDKTKILMTNGSIMKVKSITECSFGAFCNTFDMHYGIIFNTDLLYAYQYFMGAQNYHLNEAELLSTHNICFWLRSKNIIFQLLLQTLIRKSATL